MTPSQLPLALHVDKLAVNGCPAAVVYHYEGWLFRFHWGVSRRANSVWPNAQDDADLTQGVEAKISAAEDFYRRWGAQTRFQVSELCQPGDLDSRLQRRGYTATTPTEVQAALIETALSESAGLGPFTIDTRQDVHDDWLATYVEAERLHHEPAGVRRRLMDGIAPDTAFALLTIDGQPAATGLGVLDRGWVGVFGIATVPQFRRRGAATAIVRSIAEWGKQRGAENLYLQVADDNTPARALYDKLGFETLYRYHYREKSDW